MFQIHFQFGGIFQGPSLSSPRAAFRLFDYQTTNAPFLLEPLFTSGVREREGERERAFDGQGGKPGLLWTERGKKGLLKALLLSDREPEEEEEERLYLD